MIYVKISGGSVTSHWTLEEAASLSSSPTTWGGVESDIMVPIQHKEPGMPTLYSRAYLKSDAPLEDSERFRVRLTALVDRLRPDTHELAGAVRFKLGVEVDSSIYDYMFGRWISRCELRDILDFMTILVEISPKDEKVTVIATLRTMLLEEHLAFEMTDDGSVKPKVDMAFAGNVEAAIALMGKSRYAGVRREFETGQTSLSPIAPNWTQATRHTFLALETLFKLMFVKQPRLGAKEADAMLRPVVVHRYASSSTSVKEEANRMLAAFKEWIQAGHWERHAQGTEDPHAMPEELGVLMVSQGASYLRWLIELDTFVLGSLAEA